MLLIGFELNNSIANIDISDSDEMNTFCASAAGGRAASSCRNDIPENIFGINLQAGIHLPQAMGWNTTYDIIPHIMCVISAFSYSTELYTHA